jgi:MFS family permease
LPEQRPPLVTAPFVLLTVATFLFFGSVGLMVPTLPRFVRSGLGGSDRAVGVVVAAYSAAAILCRPFLAWFARVAGYRAMVLWGGLGGALFQGLLALVHHLFLLVVLRVAAGVAEALLFVGVATVVNEIAPVSRRAEAASLNSVGVFLGLGLGPVLGSSASTPPTTSPSSPCGRRSCTRGPSPPAGCWPP